MKNKVVIIIGGDGLIGRSIVKDLLLNDYYVVIADISTLVSRDIFSLKNEYKYKVIHTKIDICKKKSLDMLINKTLNKFKKIDAVINCSYPKTKKYGKRLEDVQYGEFCKNMNIHLGGYFLVNQVFAKYFKKIKSGSVINFGSIYGTITPKFHIYDNTKIINSVEYAAIKAGIMHMNNFFSAYYKKYNIRFNIVSPGGVFNNHSNLFASKYKKYTGNVGMISPNDLMGVISLLISDKSKAITGQNFIIDDGFST